MEDVQLKIDQENRTTLVTDLNSNFIVEASAGSGKTTMLVERMVALIETGQVKVSDIVAITFTKKAANEFYERFYDKLSKRSKPGFKKGKDDHSLLNDPTEQQQKYDLEALKNIDECFLGTIDAFAQKILLEHPIDAGISSSSKVLDDEEFNIEVLNIYGSILRGECGSDLKILAMDFDDNFGKDIFVDSIREYLSIPDEKLILPDLDFDSEYALLRDSFNNVMDFLMSSEMISNYLESAAPDREAKKYLDYYRSSLDLGLNYTPSTYSSIISKIEDLRLKIDVTLPANVNKFFKEDGKTLKFYRQTSEIETEADKLAGYSYIKFLRESCTIVRNRFKDKGFLTFSESIRYFVELLRRDNGRDIDVVSNIRRKYKRFLIDEFQDTDLIQSEIFYRINAIEKKDDWMQIRPIDGSMLMVGDPKQSIYHFRGADSAAYNKNCEIFENLYGEKGILHLHANYRCSKELTGYFNNVFSQIDLTGKKFPIIPDTGKGDSPYENILVYECDKADDPVKVTKIIMDLHEKGIAYKDIMITPFGKGRIPAYSKEFSKNNIPCFCEGSINFELSKLIRGVISLFKYKVLGDLYSKIELLNSPFFNCNLTKTIDATDEKVDELIKQFDDIDSNLPSEILENYLNDFRLYKALDVTGLEILIAIINLLKDAEINGSISCLNDAVVFLDNLKDKNIERLTLLGNSIDAVRIANLHKVKGLESKVVILPYSGVGNNNKPQKSYDAVKGNMSILTIGDKFNRLETHLFPDLEDRENEYDEIESNRLLYVAATRAKEILIVDRSKNSKRWTKLVNDYYAPCTLGENVISKEDSTLISEEEERTIVRTKSIIEENANQISVSSFSIKNGSSDKSSFYHPDSTTDETEVALKGALSFDKYDLPATTIGTAVHKLMEYIALSKEYELNERICYRIEKDMEEPVAELLKKVLKTIYSGGYDENNDPEIKDIYSLIKNNDCYPEVKFSYLVDKEIRYGSVDLVIESNDVTYIIDYKTDSKAEDHQPQLDAYKQAYLKFNEGKNVKTFIYRIKK